MYVYGIKYRTNVASQQVHRMTIPAARNADEARAYALIREPRLAQFVEVKNRGEVRQLTFDDPLEEHKRREWIQEHPGYVLVIDDGDAA